MPDQNAASAPNASPLKRPDVATVLMHTRRDERHLHGKVGLLAKGDERSAASRRAKQRRTRPGRRARECDTLPNRATRVADPRARHRLVMKKGERLASLALCSQVELSSCSLWGGQTRSRASRHASDEERRRHRCESMQLAARLGCSLCARASRCLRKTAQRGTPNGEDSPKGFLKGLIRFTRHALPSERGVRRNGRAEESQSSAGW